LCVWGGDSRNIIALSIFILFYISFGVFLTLNQEKIVYHPFAQDFESCSNFSSAEKITYQGTRMYVSTTTSPTIVLYHGNAGSACDRYFYAAEFTQAGYGYIIVEYAGFSNDIREPSHELIKKDVENVISYLQSENTEVEYRSGRKYWYRICYAPYPSTSSRKITTDFPIY
jgi:hypothetical protein